MFMSFNSSFLTFYLVLVSFPIMSSNFIVPNEEILEKPFPLPYERVNLNESDLRNFIDNTINNKKQPVVIFGANWCPDCRILSAVLNLKTVNEYINDNFEILYIDLGRYDINMSLMEFFDIMPQQGIPRVVILNKDNYFQEYKE
jgi:thiol-disulfide isomerase/thioredoxin